MTTILALVCLAGLSPSAPAADEKIPDDLKIVAEYGAGFSNWRSWKCTITADGKVSREFYVGVEAKKESLKLSREDLNDLLSQIKEAEFFKLKKRYAYEYVTDCPTLILDITADGKTHRVSIYALGFLKQKEDPKRFLKVWREVLKKVPSPNPEQKPEIYEP